MEIILSHGMVCPSVSRIKVFVISAIDFHALYVIILSKGLYVPNTSRCIMDSVPVFGSSEEFHTWKVLNGKPSAKLLDSITERVMAGGHVHPAIIISLLDAYQRLNREFPTARLLELSEKARPQDISPAVRISEMLMEREEPQAAAEVLANNESKDGFHRYMAEAKLYHAIGERAKAVINAKRALEHDPSQEILYEILENEDPMGNWKDRYAIQCAYERKESEEPRDGRLKVLYNVYRSWFSGDKDEATDELIHSSYYQNNDKEFLLASARMSADEKDWRSAKMMYDRILESSPIYISYEAAEAHLSAHDPAFALEIYDNLDQTSIRAMQGRIAAYVQMDSDKDILNSVFDYLDSEYVGTREYRECFEMLLSIGRLNESWKLLQAMKVSNEKDPSYLICYSKYLIKKGDLIGARRTVAKALHHSRNDIAARILSSRIRLISGDVKAADKECSRILQTDPDNMDALVLKKDILIKLDRSGEAMDVCRRILDRNPNDIATMIALSGALNYEGDTSGSVMVLRKALDIDSGRDNVIGIISMMIESEMYRDAMFICYELEKTLPGDPMLRRLRGNAEYCLGEYVKASVSFAAAAEADPHDPVIWHSKGMADEARGDLESAEVAYNRAVLLDLNQSEYWISKASVQEKFGDMHGAVESLNRAIELDPGSVFPMIRKAAILEGAGRYDEALYFMDLCMITDPGNGEIMMMDARILRESGSYENAIRRASEAHNIIHNEVSAIELANCYTAYGRRSEAVRVIESMMSSCPESSRLHQALESIESGFDEVQGQLPQVPENEDANPEEYAQIADSMAALGDYKAALRAIDSALATSGDDLKYLVKKISYLLGAGETKAAADLVKDALKQHPKNGVLHESLGDVFMAKSEYRGALQEYEKSISLGLAIPEIFMKKGDAQHGLGYYDKAIDSYTVAVNRDPDNNDMRYRLSEHLFERRYLSRAEVQLQTLLEKEPEDVRAIILYAKVKMASRKDGGVTEAYRMFRACPDPGERATEKMIAVLESAGHDDEARNLRKKDEVQPEDQATKMLASKVLRKAYYSRLPPTDADLLSSLGIEGDRADDVIHYITKKLVYGEIVPGSTTFQEMERASNALVMKFSMKDIGQGQELRLEEVFSDMGFTDVDDAKRLIAYIEKALTCEVSRDDSLKMVLDRVQGISTFEIMRACKVGIYQARQIKQLLGIKD